MKVDKIIKVKNEIIQKKKEEIERDEIILIFEVIIFIWAHLFVYWVNIDFSALFYLHGLNNCLGSYLYFGLIYYFCSTKFVTFCVNICFVGWF